MEGGGWNGFVIGGTKVGGGRKGIDGPGIGSKKSGSANFSSPGPGEFKGISGRVGRGGNRGKGGRWGSSVRGGR